MNGFNEENAVENYVRDRLCGQQATPKPDVVEAAAPYVTAGRSGRGSGWHFTPAVALPRQAQSHIRRGRQRSHPIRANDHIAKRRKSG